MTRRPAAISWPHAQGHACVPAEAGVGKNPSPTSQTGPTGRTRSAAIGRLIPPHGGYRKLRSFKAAQLAYDATVVFCERFVDRYSRTRDQMTQAARSGVQNIAEGSTASATSKKTELKLTSVARASLEELLLDYEDYLRQHGLRAWDKDSPEALAVRRKYRADKSDTSDRSDPYCLRTANAETAGQHPDLPGQPGQLPARPADETTGAGVPWRRRVHGTALP